MPNEHRQLDFLCAWWYAGSNARCGAHWISACACLLSFVHVMHGVKTAPHDLQVQHVSLLAIVSQKLSFCCSSAISGHPYMYTNGITSSTTSSVIFQMGDLLVPPYEQPKLNQTKVLEALSVNQIPKQVAVPACQDILREVSIHWTGSRPAFREAYNSVNIVNCTQTTGRQHRSAIETKSTILDAALWSSRIYSKLVQAWICDACTINVIH